MEDSLRQKLIERVQRLPASRLPQLEQALSAIESGVPALECGDSSPLSLPSEMHDRSTTEQQRLAARVSAALRNSTSERQNEGTESGDESPHSKVKLPLSKDWPHAPVHRLSEHGTYIVTAGTLGKAHFFRGDERLTLLENKLLSLAKSHGWNLEAWAVFSNHYHFVANSESESKPLDALLKRLHAESAIDVNALDRQSGRQVWFNFWDTKLTFEKSYLARLNYVHQNAVRHRLVPVANQYRWCSAHWFETTATRASVRMIYSFKTNKVELVDDFEPI